MSNDATSSVKENNNVLNLEDLRAASEVSTLQTEIQTTALNEEQEQAQNIESSDVPPNINSTVTEAVDRNLPRKPPMKKQKTKVAYVIKKEGSSITFEIWGHFTRLKDSNPPRAVCDYCGKSYATHPKLNGTTSLWTHLESKCKKYPYKLPSRHTVARDCMKIFLDEKKKLNWILKTQRICITTDTWTSLQNLNYMCLTAHWISSDWKLEK